jgi:hypothetical protein
MSTVEFLVPVLQADIPTQNGNVYPRDELEKALARFTENAKPLLVSSNLQYSSVMSLNDAVGFVTDMRLDDKGTLNATIQPVRDGIDGTFGHYNMACIGEVRNEDGVKVVHSLEFRYVSLDSTSAVVYPDSHVRLMRLR